VKPSFRVFRGTPDITCSVDVWLKAGMLWPSIGREATCWDIEVTDKCSGLQPVEEVQVLCLVGKHIYRCMLEQGRAQNCDRH
jgi:hypothetical protein